MLNGNTRSGAGPLVSVVIPNWNGGALLGRALEALERQRLTSFETIVIDNGSFDGSAADVAKRFPDVILRRLDRNSGVAKAANLGASLARGTYIAFLNSDAEPAPVWLEELVSCALRHPAAASFEPKLYRTGEPDRLDGTGDMLTWSLKAYRRGAGERDDGQYDSEVEIFAASGTASLWRAAAFRALGGFDDRFFAYYEDVDLGFRARRAGYESWFAPRSVVLHRGGGSAGTAARELECFHSVRNRWAMIVKNAPGWWLLRKAHVVAVGELFSLARDAAHGNLILHFRAYGSVLRSMRSWQASRREIQETGRLSYSELRPIVQRDLPPLRNSLGRRRRGPVHERFTALHGWFAS